MRKSAFFARLTLYVRFRRRVSARSLLAGGRHLSLDLLVLFRILIFLFLSFGATGCAGLRPVFRQSGPAVDAQTRSWQKKILKLGQDGDWLVVRGYTSTGDLVSVAGNSELSHV